MLLTSFCSREGAVTYLIDIFFWKKKINYYDQLSCIFFLLGRRCHPAIGWVSLSHPRIWSQEVLLGSYSQIRHCSFTVRYFSLHVNLRCLSINSVPGWRNRMFLSVPCQQQLQIELVIKTQMTSSVHFFCNLF